jgi:hypothetical protein
MMNSLQVACCNLSFLEIYQNFSWCVCLYFVIALIDACSLSPVILNLDHLFNWKGGRSIF